MKPRICFACFALTPPRALTRALSLTLALALALALAPALVPLVRAESPSSGDPEAELMRLETAWNDAHLHGDAAALDRLWAPDLTVVVPEMRPFAKAELLEMWKSMKVSFTEYSTTNVRVRVYGCSAVVTGQLHRARDFAGKKRTEDWLFTKTYAQRDGTFSVVAYHASPVPAP